MDLSPSNIAHSQAAIIAAVNLALKSFVNSLNVQLVDLFELGACTLSEVTGSAASFNGDLY